MAGDERRPLPPPPRRGDDTAPVPPGPRTPTGQESWTHPGPGTGEWGSQQNWGSHGRGPHEPGGPSGQGLGGPGRGPSDPYGGYRAMTLADVLDGMFRLIKDHWRVFLLAVGGVLVPLSLLSNIVLAAIAPDLIVPDFAAMFDPEQMASGQPPFGTDVLVALAAVSALSFLFVTPITWAVCTEVAGAAVAGQPVEAGAAVRRGLRRFPAVLAVFVVQALVLLALLALVVGGTVAAVSAVGDIGALVVLPLMLAWVAVAAWLYTRWALAVPVAVIEHVGPLRALRRSWRLTRRRFWWLLGTLLLVTIVATIVGSIAATPFQMLSLGAQSAAFAAAVLVSLGSVVSGLITTPVTVNALTLLYTDRRVRQEGADLLGGPPGTQQHAVSPPWSPPPPGDPTRRW